MRKNRVASAREVKPIIGLYRRVRGRLYQEGLRLRKKTRPEIVSADCSLSALSPAESLPTIFGCVLSSAVEPHEVMFN